MIAKPSAKTYAAVCSLGTLPLGNAVSDASNKNLWANDLELAMCSRCRFVQTLTKVPGAKLADDNFYVPASSKAIMENYSALVNFIPKAAGLDKESLTMEIGCGDAALLQLFYANGFPNLIGKEPNKYERALRFEIIHDFLDKHIISPLQEENKSRLVILILLLKQFLGLSLFFNALVGCGSRVAATSPLGRDDVLLVRYLLCTEFLS